MKHKYKRTCTICKNEFDTTNKCSAAKTCSKDCQRISIKQARRLSKYTQEQIDMVIKLKKKAITNNKIVQITGVNINTVKSIVRENSLQLTKEDKLINRNKNGNVRVEEKEEYSFKIPEIEDNFNIVIEKLKNGDFDNIKSICGKHNVSRVRVDFYLRKNNLHHIINRNRNEINKKTEEMATYLKNNKHKTFNAVCRKHGVCVVSTKYNLIKQGYGHLIPNRLTHLEETFNIILKELDAPGNTKSLNYYCNKYDMVFDTISKKLKSIGKGSLIRSIKTKSECDAIYDKIVNTLDGENKDKYSLPYLCKQNSILPSVMNNKLHKNNRTDLIKKPGSSEEDEVYDFVKSIISAPIERHNRSILNGLEVDIYIPSLNIGIEYCGIFWHSEYNNKDKNYHYNKMKLCNEQGVRLITIFSDEWVERNNQVKNFLMAALGVCERRFFARKCEVKDVDKWTAREFLDLHHIQGKAIVKKAYGLYASNELLGLITGNKHHRSVNGFILNRLVFKTGTLIVGGASRLLKRLISYTASNGYKELTSWSDNRWSEGGVYEKCGFTMSNLLKPDYSYVDNYKVRISKQSCTKAKLIKKGAVGATEIQMADSLEYFRIWDCGKKTWKLSV